MCRIIKDARCLELLFSVIDSYKVDFEGDAAGRKKGLPIGNLTSQFFANFYLSALDHQFFPYETEIYQLIYFSEQMILWNQFVI
ncbi:MAG: hypothetical protein PUD17_01210 [Treponema sp.]|uniref:hypothetical protein n=1 Tax=Treponema sp. TaxID=166 RepID=UPI00298E773D|nr:hypothetical protein [Treponema sp.]MDD5810696.1 hypothetical protein [Treponema sp.]